MPEHNLCDFKMEIEYTITANYPSALVFHTAATRNLGVPNLLVVNRGRAAFLECELSLDAVHTANQERMVEQIRREGGFAAFINPKNKKEVLYELYCYLDTEVGSTVFYRNDMPVVLSTRDFYKEESNASRFKEGTNGEG